MFVFGESHAFGLGVELEECWPARFVRAWSEDQGLDPTTICQMNFADPGASNAGIVRVLLSQCEAVPPDLVLIGFSNHDRTEVHMAGDTARIGPWAQQAEVQEWVDKEPCGEDEHRLRREWLDRAKGYYRFATRTQGLLETLRCILLAQYYCQSRQIRAIATCEAIPLLHSVEVTEDAALAPLLAQIDPAFLCDFNIQSLDAAGDTAADGFHCGPGSHDRIARELLAFFHQQDQGDGA